MFSDSATNATKEFVKWYDKTTGVKLDLREQAVILIAIDWYERKNGKKGKKDDSTDSTVASTD